jgi:hypothetical protein
MIFNCGLPIRFWGDAVKYAAYVLKGRQKGGPNAACQAN